MTVAPRPPILVSQALNKRIAVEPRSPGASRGRSRIARFKTGGGPSETIEGGRAGHRAAATCSAQKTKRIPEQMTGYEI